MSSKKNPKPKLKTRKTHNSSKNLPKTKTAKKPIVIDVKPKVLITPAPTTDLMELIKIDPEKLTNSHCRRFGTTNEPYEFVYKVNLHDPKREEYVADKSPELISHPNVHFGQRKLILSEIQVLLKFYQLYPNVTPMVVYVGAAKGFHLTTLSRMFPKVKFILYDGAEIYHNLKIHKMFEVHDKTSGVVTNDEPDGFFTTAKCKQLAKKVRRDRLVFISDIRFDAFDQANVMNDMMLQEEWVKILKPALSLLKFRLPFDMQGATELTYLKGDVLYGIWPPAWSTECRLLVYQKDVLENNIETYVVNDYDSILFYHNKYRRSFCQSWIPKLFKKYITSSDNIYCSCYDCIAELTVLHQYSIYADRPLNKTIEIFGKGINTNKKVSFQSTK
jgi:hypothetical protein